MVDLDVLDQYLASLEEASVKLSTALGGDDKGYVERLRVYIFDLSTKVSSMLEGAYA